MVIKHVDRWRWRGRPERAVCPVELQPFLHRRRLGSEVGLECGRANDAVGHIDRDAVVAKEFVTNNAADVEPQ